MTIEENDSMRKNVSLTQIDKEIMYWNVNALNNLAQYTQLIDRQQKNQKPTSKDLQIRDFYFTNKLTLINGKFQPDSFIQRSIEFMKNFKSLDKNSYLQSVNFENNIKKYRFWKNILQELPKDKTTHQTQHTINKIVWSYRLPTFVIFTSLIYVFMVAVGFTKMKKGKQFAMLSAGMFIADIFVQRRKSNQIFYQIPILQVKQYQKKRIELINQSIVLDGKIYEIEKKKDYETKQLIEQAKSEENDKMKKTLLQAAGYEVLDGSVVI